MTVQIHINGESAAQVIEELSALASRFSPITAVLATAPEAPKATRSRSNPKITGPATEDAPEEKAEDVKPAADPDPDQETGDDVPAVTVEELREKASVVAKSGKQAEVKALLGKFDVASISTVPEDRRNEFMKALEAL